MKNVFYQQHIFEIGGVETFLYELARLTNKHNRDFTIFYKSGDKKQIDRLQKYCRVININSVKKPIVCNKAIFNYGIDEIDSFVADEYIQVIHADFKDKSLKNYVVPNHPKIDRFICVSENNAKSYLELTGNNSEVIHNPICIDKEPTVMTLISAQRLSPEKGGNRITTLINELDKHNIPYVYHIFSESRLPIDNENVVYHKPNLDIRKWIKYADYMVLLSDTEGYSYGALESLCLGTPLIITRLPILNELHCNEKNSIILDFDMSNLDVDEIYRKCGTFKFNYEPSDKDKWLDILVGDAEYQPHLVKIIATKDYTDMTLNRYVKCGEVYDVLDYRADEIVKMGFAKILEENF